MGRGSPGASKLRFEAAGNGFAVPRCGSPQANARGLDGSREPVCPVWCLRTGVFFSKVLSERESLFLFKFLSPRESATRQQDVRNHISAHVVAQHELISSAGLPPGAPRAADIPPGVARRAAELLPL